MPNNPTAPEPTEEQLSQWEALAEKADTWSFMNVARKAMLRLIRALRDERAKTERIYATVTRALAEPPDGTGTLVEIATICEGKTK